MIMLTPNIEEHGIWYIFRPYIARAYRNFRPDPLDWLLLCLLVNDSTYVDIAMPFGARMSLQYMQQITNLLLDIWRQRVLMS